MITLKCQIYNIFYSYLMLFHLSYPLIKMSKNASKFVLSCKNPVKAG